MDPEIDQYGYDEHDKADSAVGKDGQSFNPYALPFDTPMGPAGTVGIMPELAAPADQTPDLVYGHESLHREPLSSPRAAPTIRPPQNPPVTRLAPATAPRPPAKDAGYVTPGPQRPNPAPPRAPRALQTLPQFTTTLTTVGRNVLPWIAPFSPVAAVANEVLKARAPAPAPLKPPPEANQVTQPASLDQPVDGKMIARLEGGNRRDLYGVGMTLYRDEKKKPILKDGKAGFYHANSGVTVGVGVDLGQHSERELKGWGLSEQDISKLRPYMSAKGEAAYKLPKEKPLILDQALVDKLNQGAFNQIYRQISSAYDKAHAAGEAHPGAVGSFSALPQEVRTAITASAYQMGAAGLQRSPYWSKIVSNDWSALAGALQADKSKDALRRQEEGKYLQGYLGGRVAP